MYHVADMAVVSLEGIVVIAVRLTLSMETN